MSDRIAPFWIDRSDRERLKVTGPDRAKFLHNLCTNEIVKLAVGRGCEAFVTSPQGKTLGYITALASSDSLLIRADPGALALVLPHFAKYSVFDDIEITDIRDSTFEIHVSGDGASFLLAKLGAAYPEDRELAHITANVKDQPIQIIRESPFGIEGFTLIGMGEIRDVVVSALRDNEPAITPLSSEAAEGLRVAAGTPRFGTDITAENLPQEIGRDAQAISFVKGCYLGQETVARLDALGHVNKLLKGIRVDAGEAPVPGAELLCDEKPAGVVTSSAQSAANAQGMAMAMAMIRVKAVAPGQSISWPNGLGTVCDFPIR